MTQINVTNVKVLDNPAPFTAPFRFEITFESYPPGLQEELEWKLIYVGSADDVSLDQELDSVLVGPVSVGKNVFVFEAPAPDASRIPEKDLMEVTVIILTALYREKEFIRIGYYVNNEYSAEHAELREEWERYKATLDHRMQQQQAEALRQQELDDYHAAHPPSAAAPSTPPPPSLPIPVPAMPALPAVRATSLTRNILSDAPRVTRFQIAWDDANTATRLATFEMEQDDQRKAAEEAGRVEDAPGAAEGRDAKRRKTEGEGGKEEKVADEESDDDDGEDEEDDDEEDGDDELVDGLTGEGDHVDDEKANGVAPAHSSSSSSSARVH